MNVNANDNLKLIALLISGVAVTWGMFVMGWCAIWKIYIDVPMLLVLSNIVTGIVSCITTLLVGRTISQLNQGSDVKNQPQIQTNGDGSPSPQPDINNLK